MHGTTILLMITNIILYIYYAEQVTFALNTTALDKEKIAITH